MIHKARGQHRTAHLTLSTSHVPTIAARDEDQDTGAAEGSDNEDGATDGDGAPSEGDQSNDDHDEDASGDRGEEVRNPEAKRHAEDAKKQRLRNKELQSELEAAQAELRKRDDATKGREEILERDLKEMTAKYEQERDALAAERAARQKAEMSRAVQDLFASDRTMDFIMQDLDLEDHTIDGEIDYKSVRKWCEKQLKEAPFAAKSAAGTASNGTGGAPSNGRRTRSSENTTKDLENKFPALARRS